MKIRTHLNPGRQQDHVPTGSGVFSQAVAIGAAGRAPWGLAQRSECVARWQSSGAVHWKMSSDVRGQEQRPPESELGGATAAPCV